ncbi:hypothetical protein C8J57DRAFT_1251670 [Mycena rebaudengoi]|nr:hypothetical protein C8J57DRAFT_1251670 [Mycena rebaudengoi]
MVALLKGIAAIAAATNVRIVDTLGGHALDLADNRCINFQPVQAANQAVGAPHQQVQMSETAARQAGQYEPKVEGLKPLYMSPKSVSDSACLVSSEAASRRSPSALPRSFGTAGKLKATEEAELEKGIAGDPRTELATKRSLEDLASPSAAALRFDVTAVSEKLDTRICMYKAQVTGKQSQLSILTQKYLMPGHHEYLAESLSDGNPRQYGLGDTKTAILSLGSEVDAWRKNRTSVKLFGNSCN